MTEEMANWLGKVFRKQIFDPARGQPEDQPAASSGVGPWRPLSRGARSQQGISNTAAYCIIFSVLSISLESFKGLLIRLLSIC